MVDKVSRYLRMNLLQGGADAFVQGSVATELVPADGLAILITQVEFVFKTVVNLAVVGSYITQWSLTRDTKTAVAFYDDTDCVLSDAVSGAMTTSGANGGPQRFFYQPPSGIIIVEDTIYGQLDSTNTTLANECDVLIQYENIKLSEVEILRLLNNA